ncbi:MAG: choice-of-anchor Q domain-containing protein, partial [Phycisphaerales bacterium]|nr:choice-of-anchor Q domain-containing protein [Phycisphaerales bacterium]
VINEAIALYGGFDGTEASIGERDLSLHHTILSGDLYGNDDPGDYTSENAYHVVTVTNVNVNSVTINGFWVHSGNANVAPDDVGGGILIDSSVTIPINIDLCRIQGNDSIKGGGIATLSNTADLSLLQSKIFLNSATTSGGGLYLFGHALIDSCAIAGNRSSQGVGGGIITDNDLSILNTTIVQNSAQFVGGISSYGITIDVQNSILWGNTSVYGSTNQVQRNGATMTSGYSCIEDLPDDLIGNNNTPENPHFTDPLGPDGVEGTGDENFRLFQGSPCIDAGDNTVVTTTLDLDGNSRFIDDPYTVDTGNNPNGLEVSDMGPYEFTPADPNQDGVRMWSGSSSNTFQDVANWAPLDVPGELDTASFGIGWVQDINSTGNILIDSFNISEGIVKLDLGGNYILFRNTIDSIRIGRYGVPASLEVGNGNVYGSGDIIISGEQNKLKIMSNATLQTDRVSISDRAVLNLANEVAAEVVNSGGIIDLAGVNISGSTIYGNLNIVPNSEDPILPSEIIFDIAGNTAGVTHDLLSVTQAIDMTGMTINLRYDELWTPIIGDTFNLIDSVNISGLPKVLFYSGLADNFGTVWEETVPARGGGNTSVTTTGPILFDAAITMAISATPNDIVTADFDGIQGIDVAVSMPATGGSSSVEVFLNNGMSSGVWQGFANPIVVSTGSSTGDLEVGDIDNDTFPDLVVTNYDDDTITILMNDGTAGFTTTPLSTGAGSGPISLAFGDFDSTDGLGLSDLAVGCDTSPVGVQIYTNSTALSANGPRVPSFSLSSTWLTPVPTDINPVDTNDDKDLDIIVLSGPGNSVTLKRGNGDGTTMDFMSMPTSLPGGSSPVAGVVSLLDTDSFEDFITSNNGGGSLSILAGNGSTLNAPSTVTIGDSPVSINASDLDNDGDDDLIVSELDGSEVRQLAIIRNDTTTSVVTLGSGSPAGNGDDPTLIATGNFDVDALQDIVAIIDLAPTMRANSPAIGVYFNSTAIACLGPEDTNGDGIVDVTDLLALIGAWGTNDPQLDLDGSGLVDVGDILMIISAWGPCTGT